MAVNDSTRYLSWPRYEFVRDHQQSFAYISAAGFASYTLTRTGADPEQLNALQISASFLPTLGVTPYRGRNFTPAEDTAGGPKVAILSFECWQRFFGGKEGIIGQNVQLGGAPYEVVGVLPPALSNPYHTVMVFVPRAFEPQDIALPLVQNGAGFLDVTARLKDGVSYERAVAEVKTLAENYRTAFPAQMDARQEGMMKTFAEELVGNIRPTFRLLLGAVALVMVIACLNVAALFLGRLSARRKDVALRLSLGATRGDLVRQFLAESLVFSGAAGLLSTLVGVWALALIQHLIASAAGNSGVAGALATNPLPTGVIGGLDGATLAFTFGVSGLSAFLVACIPAAEASRPNVAHTLKEAGRGTTGGSRATRLYSMLIVGEVALSVVLLIGSALLLASLGRLQHASTGFEAKGVATAYVSLADSQYTTELQQANFFSELVARLEAQPRVKSAAIGYDVPLTGFQATTGYAVAGRALPRATERPRAWLDRVSEHYFAAMGVALRDGRPFDPRDNDRAPNVCIVNESLAKRLFPGTSALGKVLLRGRSLETRSEIVGVVADVRAGGLSEPAPDEIYVPFRQQPQSVGTLVVRAKGDPAALDAAMRAALRALDRNVALTFFTTMDSAVGSALILPRITTALTSAFAVLALVLAAVGLYSVLAYTVTRRTSEIGLRMALGAQRAAVIALVLRAGLRLVGVGVAIGLVMAAGLARLIQTLLFDVPPLEPSIYAGVALLFVTVAALACLVPSWRASRIDPIIALRAE